MYTTRTLIEALQRLQQEHGPMVVAIQNGEELPDIKSLHVATDTGQTEEKIVVIVADVF